MWVDFSFIYWQAIEENLDPAVSLSSFANNTSFGFSGNNTGEFIRMDFDFKPGFKVGVGVGFDYDKWDVQAEYTYFHGDHEKEGSGGDLLPTQLSAFSDIAFLFAVSANVSVPAFSFEQEWDLDMDILDVDLGRWFYVGTKLTFRPYLGIRAAWISQDLDTEYAEINNLGATATVDVDTDSWAVGPRVGLDGNWMLPYGLRVFGNGSADILFTRYEWEFHESVVGLPNSVNITTDLEEEHINCLRTHLDLILGC